MKKRKLTYRSAGVDVKTADKLVKQFSVLAKSARRREMLAGPGGFGGLFSFPAGRYQNPVLTAAADGVGTKLKLATLVGKHDTVGIDLVAMNVNDVLACGAEPLFFLDYIAAGRIEPVVLKDVVRGIARGCRRAGCCLLGGETAEMPGMYSGGDYDLAGFCVGVVERKKILDGASVREGDILLGLASSGIHSNGFSLVRKVFSQGTLKGKVGRELLTPTRIYVRPVLSLLRYLNSRRKVIRGIAHITGGGFPGNIPRVLPDGLCAKIERGSWPVPKIFSLIQKEGDIDGEEMFRTFNMGLGMVLLIQKKAVPAAVKLLKKHKFKSWTVGKVIRHRKKIII